MYILYSQIRWCSHLKWLWLLTWLHADCGCGQISFHCWQANNVLPFCKLSSLFQCRSCSCGTLKQQQGKKDFFYFCFCSGSLWVLLVNYGSNMKNTGCTDILSISSRKNVAFLNNQSALLLFFSPSILISNI